MLIVLDWILFVIVSIAVYFYRMDQPIAAPVKEDDAMEDEYADMCTPSSTDDEAPLSCMDDRLSPLLSLLSQLQPAPGTILPEPSQFNRALIILQSSSSLPPSLHDYISLNLRKAIKYDARRGKTNGSSAAVMQYYDAVKHVITSALDGCYDAFAQTCDHHLFVAQVSDLIDTIQEDEDFYAWEYKLRALKILRHDIRWHNVMKNKSIRHAFKACEAMLELCCKLAGAVESTEHRVLIHEVVDKLSKVKHALVPVDEPVAEEKPYLAVATADYTTTRMRSISQSMRWPAGPAIVKTA